MFSSAKEIVLGSESKHGNREEKGREFKEWMHGGRKRSHAPVLAHRETGLKSSLKMKSKGLDRGI